MGPRSRNRRHAFAVALATEPELPVERARVVELYREAGLGEGSTDKALRSAARRAEKRLAEVVTHHRGAVLVRPRPAARAAAKSTPGRDTYLTEEVHKVIVGLIRQGHKPRPAAARAGVNPATFDRWMWRGRKEPDVQPYGQFAQDVAGAEPRGQYRFEEAAFLEALGKGKPKYRRKYERDGDGKMALVEEVEETRLPDVKAIMEILSRRYAREWPKVQRIEVADAAALVIVEALERLGDVDALQQIEAGTPAAEVWAGRVPEALPEGEA